MSKKLSRRLSLGLTAIFLLSLVVGVSGAQEELVMVIGWEQEPDRPALISESAFSVYLQGFYQRDVWDWRGEEREIFPIMVEEVPTFENGLVTTVPVTGDFNDDGTDEEAEAPVVTYRLRANMHWSDGQPVTADDCVFYHNLMMMENPVDSVQRGFYPQVVDNLEKLDDLTVRLTYNAPWPDYLNTAQLSCAYPAHLLLPYADTDGDGVFDGNVDESPYMQDFTQSLGYGPYILTEYNAGQNIVFERNPLWGENAWEVVPAIDRVIVPFILESEQMENALRVGDIDMAYNFTTTDGYEGMDGVEVWGMIGVFNDALWMNAGSGAHPALQDPRVREAIVHAIDRRTLAEQFIGPGAGEAVPSSYFPEAFVPEDLPFREYDPERAAQLLDESGWIDTNDNGIRDRDGVELVLRFFTTPRAPRPEYQTFIQSVLSDLGVGTQLFTVNGPTVLFASYSERGILNTGEYDLAIFGRSNNPLSPAGDPDSWHCAGIPSAENPSGQNSSFFCNEEFDRLDTLVATTNEPEERLQYHYELEPIFYDAAIWHGLYIRIQYYAVRADRWNVESMLDMGTLEDNYFNQVEYWQPAAS